MLSTIFHDLAGKYQQLHTTAAGYCPGVCASELNLTATRYRIDLMKTDICIHACTEMECYTT